MSRAFGRRVSLSHTLTGSAFVSCPRFDLKLPSVQRGCEQFPYVIAEGGNSTIWGAAGASVGSVE